MTRPMRLLAYLLLLAGPFAACRALEWHTWTEEYIYQEKTYGAKALIMETTIRRVQQLHDSAAAVLRVAFAMPADGLVVYGEDHR